MNLVPRQQLQTELAEGCDIKLVLSLGTWAFQAQHIPGSMHFESPQSAFEALDHDDEIVVYCTGPDSTASTEAYDQLTARGYRHVRRYAGGLTDWARAGLPIEGHRTG